MSGLGGNDIKRIVVVQGVFIDHGRVGLDSLGAGNV